MRDVRLKDLHAADVDELIEQTEDLPLPGGCDRCEAWRTVKKESDDEYTLITHHDAWCSRFREISSDSVVVRWRSESALAASVRDSGGSYDLRFDSSGWSCSCGQAAPCAHAQRVRVLGAVATA